MKKSEIISILLFFLGLLLCGSYHIYYYFAEEKQEEIVNDYMEKEETKKEEPKHILGILEIPVIHFQKPFYDIESEDNNVNKNIQVLKGSMMPNNAGKTLFLAAHSGNSYLGYFKELIKLQKEDLLIIHYQGQKYSYYINDIYELPKNGTIEIIKNSKENYLVLTTCHNDKQLVITAKLLKIEGFS